MCWVDFVTRVRNKLSLALRIYSDTYNIDSRNKNCDSHTDHLHSSTDDMNLQVYGIDFDTGDMCLRNKGMDSHTNDTDLHI